MVDQVRRVFADQVAVVVVDVFGAQRAGGAAWAAGGFAHAFAEGVVRVVGAERCFGGVSLASPLSLASRWLKRRPSTRQCG